MAPFLKLTDSQTYSSRAQGLANTEQSLPLRAVQVGHDTLKVYQVVPNRVKSAMTRFRATRGSLRRDNDPYTTTEGAKIVHRFNLSSMDTETSRACLQ